MNHLFAGMVFPFALACALYALRRGRISLPFLIGVPLAMLTCATWAVLPDLPRMLGFADYDPLLSDNPGIDIFFWHYSLSRRGAYGPGYSVGVTVMLACLFVCAWRVLRKLEKS